MLNYRGIFKDREVNEAHLLTFGFQQIDEKYHMSFKILNNQFRMDVVIQRTGEVATRVFDCENQEEYVLIHTMKNSGEFVSSVIQACEEILNIIAEECFEYAVFHSEQAKQIIDYVDKTYEDQLEFLWKKFSNNAVFRCKDSGKWYAALLVVSKEKLGLEGNGTIEIMDLRALPDTILEIVDGKKYFPGYHMNKMHWYTICLDGSVPMQEIYQRIEASYRLAKKK